MKTIFLSRRTRWTLLAVVGCIGAVIATLLWINRPHAKADAQAATVLVVAQTRGELCLDGKPMVYFSNVVGDSVLSDATADDSLATHTRNTMGCWVNEISTWPSCEGRIVTIDTIVGKQLHSDVNRVVRATKRLIGQRIQTLNHDLSELRYYLRVHGVQDEGYHDIAQLTEERSLSLSRDKRTLALLDSIGNTGGRLSLRLVTTYSVRQLAVGTDTATLTCHFVSADTLQQLVLLRTDSAETPHGAKPVVLPPWTDEADGEVLALSLGGIGAGLTTDAADTLVIVGGEMTAIEHDFPRLLVADGSPVFTPSGHFVGIVRGRKIVSRATVRQLVRKGGTR